MATGDSGPDDVGAAELPDPFDPADGPAVTTLAVGVGPTSAVVGAPLRGDTATATRITATTSDARTRRLDNDRRGTSGPPNDSIPDHCRRSDLAAVDATARRDVPAERAVEWLRVLGRTWASADVPEAKADLLHAIYDRIVVAGPSIVSVRLTPAAYANGLALALPQVVMARPEVARPTVSELRHR